MIDIGHAKDSMIVFFLPMQDFVGLMLESVVYEILKVFIRQEPYYLQVLELFQEVNC